MVEREGEGEGRVVAVVVEIEGEGMVVVVVMEGEGKGRGTNSSQSITENDVISSHFGRQHSVNFNSVELTVSHVSWSRTSE